MLNTWWGMDWPGYLLFPFCFVCLLLLFWSERRKIRVPFWGAVFLVTAAAGMFLHRRGYEMGPYFYVVRLAAVALAAGIVCYAASSRLWLQALIVLPEMACMIAFCIQRKELAKWAVFVMLFGVVIFAAELAGGRGGAQRARKSVFLLLPVLLVALLPICFLPVRKQPVRWELVKTVVKAVEEKLVSLKASIEYMLAQDGSAYSLSFSGFGGNGLLGGNIETAHEMQLSVEGDRTMGPLYLAGSVRDSYDGHGWSSSEAGRPYEEAEYVLNGQEWNIALDRSVYSREEINELTGNRVFSLRYEGIKTKSIFYPCTALDMAFDSPQTLVSGGDMVMLKKARGVGFSYRLWYREVNYGSEQVKELLRHRAWETEPVLTGTLRKREEFIHENYTILPEGLPERVYELADEITAGADNDYDRLEAIREYLSAFTYTTAPGEAPKDREFTDYFLFDLKKGYCTYFATAMAVLARCEGIPTRYVEGFVAGDTRKYGYRKIGVYADNAHAWAEAYIDGIGWIPFEATPGYAEAARQDWIPPAKVYGSQAGLSKPDEPQGLAGDASADRPLEASDRREKALRMVRGGASLLLMAVCAVMVFFLLRRIIRGRWYAGKNYEERTRFLMRRILLLGKLAGLELEEGETLSAYGARAGQTLDTPGISFREVCSLFQARRFGGKSFGVPEMRVFERYAPALERKCLASCGWWRRMVYLVTAGHVLPLAM